MRMEHTSTAEALEEEFRSWNRLNDVDIVDVASAAVDLTEVSNRSGFGKEGCKEDSVHVSQSLQAIHSQNVSQFSSSNQSV